MAWRQARRRQQKGQHRAAASCRRPATCCTAGWRGICWRATGATLAAGRRRRGRRGMKRRQLIWRWPAQQQRSRQLSSGCSPTQTAQQTCRSRRCRPGRRLPLPPPVPPALWCWAAQRRQQRQQARRSWGCQPRLPPALSRRPPLLVRQRRVPALQMLADVSCVALFCCLRHRVPEVLDPTASPRAPGLSLLPCRPHGAATGVPQHS